MPGCAKDCYAALVHLWNDDNAIWTEHTVTVSGQEGFMLSKRTKTNPGHVLAAACYPATLPSHGAVTQWKPLPDRHGIMVKLVFGFA